MAAAGQFPRPGQLTHPDNIPADMRERFPWCMYKLVRKGAKFKKVPVAWRNGFSEIDPDDPMAQGTFDEVVNIMRANADGWYGIGIVLTPETRALCFDADTPQAFGLLDQMNEHARTYVETSISGVGRHYLWQGTLPHNRSAVIDKALGIEVYAHDRFIAITGNVLPQGNGHIADGSDMFAQMFAKLPPPREDISLGETGELGRHLGLTDKRVVNILAYRCRWAYDLLASNAPLADRSEQLMRIVGDLDKITGSPVQIWRIMANSPMITGNAYNAEKFQRRGLFDSWVADAREGRDCNNQALPNVTLIDDGEGPSVEQGKRIGAELAAIAAHNGGVLPRIIDDGGLGVPVPSLTGKLALTAEDRRESLEHPASLTKAMLFENIDHMVEYFNLHYYVVMHYGGQPAIFSTYGATPVKEKDFLAAHRHIRVNVETTDKKGATVVEPTAAAPLWLQATRERYLSVVYSPIGVNETPLNFMGQGQRNTWQGFGCTKVEIEQGIGLSRLCPTIWEYLWEVISSERTEVVEYLVKWLADAIQNPRRTEQRTALVFYSPGEGTGKTTFGVLAGNLFHHEHTAIVRFEDLDSRFTSRLENKAMLVCNEFFMPTPNMRGVDAASVDKFKARIFDLIDHGKMTAERKTKDATEVNNFARVVLSSNKAVLLPQGSRARRMFFVEPSESHMGNVAFWNRLHYVLARRDGEGGELDRFFSWLAEMRLDGFVPQGGRPMSREMREQLQQAMSGLPGILHRLIDNGELPYVGEPRALGSDGYTLHYFVQQGDPITGGGVRGYMAALAGHPIHASPTAFGREVMSKMSLFPKMQFYNANDGSGTKAGRWWPELHVARKHFEKVYNNGIEMEWENSEQKSWIIGKNLGKQ